MPTRTPSTWQADVEQLSRSPNKLLSIFTKRPRSHALHLRPPPSPSSGRAAPDGGLAWASPRGPGRGSPRSADARSWTHVGGLSVSSPAAHALAPARPAADACAGPSPAAPRECDVQRLRCAAAREAPVSATGSSDELLCSVCLEDVCVGDDAAVLPCGHHFHFLCVQSWILAKGCCPNCRKHILLEEE